MLDSIDDILLSAIHRTLDLEPLLEVKVAASRVAHAATTSGLAAHDSRKLSTRVEGLTGQFRRCGILNPNWLAYQGSRPHFFLVNAQPGWLEQLVSQAQEKRDGISQYIVYGEWDSLIILRGSDAEAADLRAAVEASTYLEPTYFGVSETLLLYRYEPVRIERAPIEANASTINEIVADYDNPKLRAMRDALVERGVFLGPTWVPQRDSSHRVVAFVGISLRGRHNVKAAQVLEALRSNDVLRSAMVHLFETERGHPFDYFAKLVCTSMTELDDATNAIGYTRIGNSRFEGVTQVVAKGHDHLPVFRPAARASVMLAPDLSDVVNVARGTLMRFGPEALGHFNDLNAPEKIIVLRSLEEIERELGKRNWDDEREKGIQSAVGAFARAALAGLERLNGAVVDIAGTVEELLRHAVRLSAEAVFGRDHSRIQKELKLPTRKLQELSLGKALNAFRVAREHAEFGFLTEALSDQWLQRIDDFADSRNKWAHNAMPADIGRDHMIDEARRSLVNGIRIISWLSGTVIPTARTRGGQSDPVRGLLLPERRDGREFGIFVSHSTADKAIAERIANGLVALDYPVWYAGWAIDPSESIVQKIEEALAKNDTLVILLSPNSVASKWVLRELNSALMAQLSGQSVLVVPVLIAPCEIPSVLADVKYVDLVDDFEDGFIKLLEFLRKRRRPRGDNSGA